MSKIRWTRQGGSVVLFVIAGVLLTSFLVGGIYLLNDRGNRARRDQAIAVVDQQIVDNSSINNEPEITVEDHEDYGDVGVSQPQDDAEIEDLPVTGPESYIIESIIIGLSTATIVAYLKSRRDLMRYL